MRLVVCADAHLDSVFPTFKNNPGKMKLRQEEQRMAFSKAITEVKRIDAHLFMLPGDLFNEGTVTQETIDFLISSFNSIPDTLVVIAPGNNDPASYDSVYLNTNWPENVYIFKRGLEALELTNDDLGEKIRVYGAGFQGHSCKTSLLRQNNTLPILDKDFINLLVMHGSVTANEEENTCNPIYIKDLDTCGFDFCALGHIHKFSEIVSTGKTTYAYTGVCEGRSFKEPGPCGILSGTITKESVEMNFVKTSVRENCIVKVDISDLESYDSVLDRIRLNCSNSEFLYKIILTGNKKWGLNIPVSKLSADLSSDYFYVKVYAEYKDEINIDILKHENSLRGCFVRCMTEKMEKSDNTELVYEALVYGLQSFDEEVCFNDNP